MFLNVSVLNTLISNDLNENIFCAMGDVRGDVFGPPDGTKPAAVIENKI